MRSTSQQPSLGAMVGFLSEVERSRVLVVGDAVLDEYVEGSVERISPEAPVPVLRVQSRHRLAGGAAHVAHVAAALGASVELIAVVGTDTDGDHLAAACRSNGVAVDGVIASTDRPTTVKTRVVSGSQQIARLDREDDRPLSTPDRDAVLRSLDVTPRPDVVVLSDYAKGMLDDEVIGAVMAAADRWQIPVLVDPKGSDLGRYRGADVIKLNRDELASAVATAVDDDLSQIDQHAAHVRQVSGASTIVVTLGAGGIVTTQDGRPPMLLAATNHEVFDVTGAGDVVAAVVALALASGASIDEAAAHANLAAGLSVRRRGSHGVDASALLQELELRSGRSAIRAPLPQEQVAFLARVWRRAGEQIVFTNGCFDLFHRGHLELLRRAAELGDRLIVAVDSDASVRRLKGADRPVVGERDRADIIGALSFVDAIVLFDTELDELVESVSPDVLVKGADHLGRELVGQAHVEATGGRVELVPLVDGRSTTAIVSRVRNRTEPTSTSA